MSEMIAPTLAPDGHVVAITGGSSGIGLSTALLFARRGWRVGLIARAETGLEAAAARVRELGAPVETVSVDVTDLAALSAAVARIEAALGPISVWVNNAGVGFVGRLADTPPETFRRVLDTTFLGQVNGTRVALGLMAPRDAGCVIGIGSEVAFRGVPLLSAYSASKFALRGFYDAVRAELLHDRVHVHVGMVHPPSVNTPFFSHAGVDFGAGHDDTSPRPPPPVYEPELVAEAVFLAASEHRREVVVGGFNRLSMAASRLMPGVVDRLLATGGMLAQRTHRRDVAALRAPSLQHGTGAGVVHGPFRREARTASMQMWLQRNRYAVGLAGIGLAMALRPRRRRRRYTKTP